MEPTQPLYRQNLSRSRIGQVVFNVDVHVSVRRTNPHGRRGRSQPTLHPVRNPQARTQPSLTTSSTLQLAGLRTERCRHKPVT